MNACSPATSSLFGRYTALAATVCPGQRLIFLITWLGFTLAADRASLHLFSLDPPPTPAVYNVCRLNSFTARHPPLDVIPCPHYTDRATPLLICIASFWARSRFKENVVRHHHVDVSH
jgi:hypothetical protein